MNETYPEQQGMEKIVYDEQQIMHIRASAFPKLFSCAYRFEYQNLMGNHMPAGLRALLGTSIHAGTAAFDQGKIDESGVSADDAAGVVVDTLRNPEFEVDYGKDDLSIKQAESIGTTLTTRYCFDVSPNFEFRSVEMKTKPLDIDCGGGVIVRLTGTMDRSRVRRSTKGNSIIDLKSGAAAVVDGRAKTKGHGPQVGTYELLFEHTTGEKITEDSGIIGLKTSGSPEIATGTITGAKKTLVGWDDQPGLIEFAAHMMKTGKFYPNPSDILCSKKYCARWDSCAFRDR